MKLIKHDSVLCRKHGYKMLTPKGSLSLNLFIISLLLTDQVKNIAVTKYTLTM